jgi:dihydroorotate dehydrogenase (fumarate)
MDLSTTYLGFKLPHPVMPGASPLVDNLDMVRRLEDAGAAAIVMHSLFEEQIALRRPVTLRHLDASPEPKVRTVSYFPSQDDFALNSEQYLEHVRRIKEMVSVPVIASLNGATPAWWLEYARLIEEAGADALELNIYFMAVDPLESADSVDRRFIEPPAT